MKRVLCILLVLGFVTNYLQAQTPAVRKTLDRPLNSTELAKEPWFYNLDSALAHPEAVYKLSLKGQKLKSLPPEIGLMTNLQVLDLSENKLKSLPPEIENLKKVQLLSLYHNKIQQLPIEIRGMERLEVLYLSRNRLFDMPVWIGGLGRLRRLDISRNRMGPLRIQQIKNMLPKVDITY